jgi:hypothetical protein
MRFDLINGALHIQSETSPEVLEMIKHYKLDPLTHIEALSTGSLLHVAQSTRRDNGQWFAVSADLGAEWMAPYLAKLTQWTGFAGEVPSIAGPRYPGGYAVNLCHTHIVESMHMGSHGFTFAGYLESQDWDERKAADRAPPYFRECVSGAVGDTKQEGEFIEFGNGGLLRRNPNYMKRHYPHAAASSALVFECLLQWWIATHATPGQRDILAQCLANHRTVCKGDTLGAYLLRSYERGYRLTWGGELVTLEAFKGA